MIVAMAKNRVIGKDGALPWNLADDLKNFKAITVGKDIIMGRKTYVSIGKPLPKRNNIIITRDKNFTAGECDIVYSIEEVFDKYKTKEEIMVIGGGEIYTEFMAYTSKIYLTIVDATINGDTYFPELNNDEWNFSLNKNFSADNRNSHSFDIYTLTRK